MVMWAVICAFFVLLGLAEATRATSELPGVYSLLSARGIRATAEFAGCHYSGFGRGRTEYWAES